MSVHFRHALVVRSVATITGDIAVGTALASTCLWFIEAAALGLFLSFVAWLLAALISLALSQHLVHPCAHLALSDRKLDSAMHTVRRLSASLGALASPERWRRA